MFNIYYILVDKSLKVLKSEKSENSIPILFFGGDIFFWRRGPIPAPNPSVVNKTRFFWWQIVGGTQRKPLPSQLSSQSSKPFFQKTQLLQISN